MKKRDLQVLSVRQEVQNYSVTYRQSLDDHTNSLAKTLFHRTICNRRLKRYYPADLATRFELVLCKIPSDQNQSIVIELQYEIYHSKYLLHGIDSDCQHDC